MPTRAPAPLPFLLAISLALGPDLAHAQGPLTPPGGPAPSMKTLSQIDARLDALSGQRRIPVEPAPAPIVLSAPGSYFLTGNVTGAAGQNTIEIAADGVTLDLNGYTLLGVAGGKAAVALPSARKAVRVFNGNILGGVDGFDTAAAACQAIAIEEVAMTGLAGAAWNAHAASSGLSFRRGRVQGCGTGIDLRNSSGSIIADSSIGNVSLAATYGDVLQATRVERCTVSGVSGPGILCGISASGSVLGSSVSGLSGGTHQVGITSEQILDCRVRDCAGAPVFTGLAGTQTQRCAVEEIITTTGGTAIGIQGIGEVLDCVVRNFSGVSEFNGINGRHVQRCSIDDISLATGSGPAVGISASGDVFDCQVRMVMGDTTAEMLGIQSTSARRCGVLWVVNANTSGGTSTGIRVSFTAESCNVGESQTGISFVGDGFGASLITGCACTFSGSIRGVAGIRTRPNGVTRVEGNTVSNFTTGIVANGPEDLVIRNHTAKCAAAVGGNANASVGPVVTGGGTIATTNPWANFEK